MHGEGCGVGDRGELGLDLGTVRVRGDLVGMVDSMVRFCWIGWLLRLRGRSDVRD